MKAKIVRDAYPFDRYPYIVVQIRRGGSWFKTAELSRNNLREAERRFPTLFETARKAMFPSDS